LKPGVIDEPLPLVPLKRISPSRYAQLKACALREIWTAGGSPIFVPRNPAALLGTIAHHLLKDAGQNAANKVFDAERRWGQLVDGMNQELKKSWLEAVLSPLETSAAAYEVLKIRTCVRASQISSTRKKRGSGLGIIPGTGFELWVESQDKSIGGWIDAARRTKDGIVLTDFKSGDVLARPQGILQKELKESHRTQLKLYAALYFQTYRIWPNTIQIAPLTGTALEVPFTQKECSRLIDEAATTFTSVNSLISTGTPAVYEGFATPSPQNCRFCSFRPACPEYRKARKSGEPANGWPIDSFGTVWDINVLHRGDVNLRVAGDSGEKHTFRALSSNSKRHPALQTIQRGDVVGIFNAFVSSNGKEFSEGMQTVLYKLTGPTPPGT
jgi:hypothetical protein